MRRAGLSILDQPGERFLVSLQNLNLKVIREVLIISFKGFCLLFWEILCLLTEKVGPFKKVSHLSEHSSTL